MYLCGEATDLMVWLAAILLTRQLIEQADQLVLGSEVDFDATLRALANNPDPRTEAKAKALFGRARVNVGGLRRRLIG